MFKIFLIILMMLTFSSCTEKKLDKPSVARYLEDDSKILALGDSLTFGQGAKKSESYPSVLEKIANQKNKVKVINEGVNGFDTEDLKDKIHLMLEKHSPHLILINIGGNDFLRKIDINQTNENLRYILDTIKSKRIPIVLIAEPKPSVSGLITGLEDHEIYVELADKYKVPLVSNVFSEYLSDNQYKSDFIHLNALGYHAVAEEIYKELVLQQFLY